jgi:predicted HNH restriction endonuclease
MEQIVDFLKHFDPESTPRELVSEYYTEYQKSGDNTIEYNTRNNKTDRHRAKVIKGCECAICGLTYAPVLQVHHVLPLSDGGNNNIDNLVVLCSNCHKAVHSTIYSRDFTSAREMYSCRKYKLFKRFVNYKR